MTSSFSPYVRLWQRAFTPNKKHRIYFLHQGKREKHSGTPPCSQLPSSCMRCGAFWSALVARAGPRWFMVQPDVVRSFINTQTANQQAPLPHTARSRPSDYQNNVANISVFNIPSLCRPAYSAAVSKILPHSQAGTINACWAKGERISCFSPCGRTAPQKVHMKGEYLRVNVGTALTVKCIFFTHS